MSSINVRQNSFNNPKSHYHCQENNHKDQTCITDKSVMLTNL